MYEKPDRPRGVVLRVLDTDAICTAVAEQLDNGSEYEVAFAPYAVAQTVNGMMFVICREGVGWQVSCTQPLQLDLYAKVTNAISVLPSFAVNLTPAQIDLHTTEVEIDLADLIRTFGGRLEDNFWAHYHRLFCAVATL